jgi:hypothetical protein
MVRSTFSEALSGGWSHRQYIQAPPKRFWTQRTWVPLLPLVDVGIELERAELDDRPHEGLPILNILAPHSGHVPWVAGRPFFIVTGMGSFISRLVRHFMQ